jgi:hypothetical protein
MEPRAGLANISLLGNDNSSALTHAEYILNHLETVQSASAADLLDQAGAVPGLEATHDPMWIYLVCCQVLSKTNDLRAADLIKTAYELLQQQSSRITDPDLHFSFINNVKTNQEINSLYARGADG